MVEVARVAWVGMEQNVLQYFYTRSLLQIYCSFVTSPFGCPLLEMSCHRVHIAVAFQEPEQAAISTRLPRGDAVPRRSSPLPLKFGSNCRGPEQNPNFILFKSSGLSFLTRVWLDALGVMKRKVLYCTSDTCSPDWGSQKRDVSCGFLWFRPPSGHLGLSMGWTWVVHLITCLH